MTPPRRTPRILIVDDEILLGRTIRRSLGANYDTVVLDSGAAAIASLTDDRAFDCVLCDLQMPNVSGMDVYAWVTQNAPELADRFVFMTGGTFTDRARAFVAQLAREQLDKPFDAMTLRHRVAQVCGPLAPELMHA